MKNKMLSSELVTGRSSRSFFPQSGMLPNPDKILAKTGKTIEAYREVKNDPHVWSCIQSRKSGILSLETTIVAGDAGERLLNEVQKMMSQLDLTSLMRDILEAPLFGFQALEIVWEANGGAFSRMFPRRVESKPHEAFFFDVKGNLRIRQEGGKDIPRPEYKFLLARYEHSFLNPYGEPLLGKCYWPVTFKEGGMRFWVNFMERYGMPLLLGQYKRGATYEEAQKLANDLANMTEDTVIVTPSDITLTMYEAMRTSSVDLYSDLIKVCNAEISKALLSQTLTTELDMGSYAAAETHFKIRKEVIQSDIRIVEQVINELIRYFVEINYGKSPQPEFKIVFNNAENEQMVDRDVRLTQSGSVKFSKSYWMRNYGFKEEDLL